MLRWPALVTLILTVGLLAAQQPALHPPLDAPRPIEAHDSVWIEDLTWMEVRDALKAGKTTEYRRGLIKVTGTLSLNRDNPEGYLFSLKDARVGGAD